MARRFVSCLRLLLLLTVTLACARPAAAIDLGPYSPNFSLSGTPSFLLPSTAGLNIGPRLLLRVSPVDPCIPGDPCREPTLTLLGGTTPSIHNPGDLLNWRAIIGIDGLVNPTIPNDPCLPFQEPVAIGGGYSVQLNVSPSNILNSCQAIASNFGSLGIVSVLFSYEQDPPVTVGFIITDEAGNQLAAGAPIPEPATIALLGTALLGLGATRRRRIAP